MTETDNSGVMSLTVTLLSAYFANNTVPSSELPTLVEGTRRALLGDAAVGKDAPITPTAEGVTETPPPSPDYKAAVSIEESLASPDHILSLIDGKPYKTLKRHVSSHGLTPAEYRTRYDLPADYPFVAANYSAARREVARKLGLGGKRKGAPAPAVEVPSEKAPESPPVEEVKPVVADAPAAKPASTRRSRAKVVETKPQPEAKKPKGKVSRGASAKAPAASKDAAPKPKRNRTRKATGETTAPTEAAPEISAAAE